MRTPHWLSSCIALTLVAALGFAVAFAPRAVAGQKFYTWVDDKNVTHYSDQPQPGAKEVHVAPAQTYSSSSASGAPRAPSPPASAAKPRDEQKGPYTIAELVKPTADQVFVNTGEPVELSALLQPELGPAHRIWFVIDGTRRGEEPGVQTSVEFDLDRGTHTAAFEVIDGMDKVVQTSPTVTFHVREITVPNPARGPAVTKQQPTIRPVQPRPRKP